MECVGVHARSEAQQIGDDAMEEELVPLSSGPMVHRAESLQVCLYHEEAEGRLSLLV